MDALRSLANLLALPQVLLPAAGAVVLAVLRWRWPWTRRAGLGLAAVSLVAFTASLGSAPFRHRVSQPDNVAILVMLASTCFFVWLGLKQACENDERIDGVGEPVEAPEYREHVLSWPHLVSLELIFIVGCTAAVLVWSLLAPAPLEEPANPAVTSNPAKAPWYFLGLQEMLVYFDPWIAGVLLPGLVVFGLCAIPYLDPNPRGSGYYTLRQRPFAIAVFLFGFLVLWVVPIVIGTFLRGPNWSFFGPFEAWDVLRLDAASTLDLSELVYVRLLGTATPTCWLWREVWGLALLAVWFGLGPVLLGRGPLRGHRRELGSFRYHLFVFLLLAMAGVPVKMLLRWVLDLKYVLALPEISLSI